MDKNEKIAEAVLNAIGGKENIDSVFHCATRLRFTLKSMEPVKQEILKNTDGVLGIKQVGTSNSFQVIIGPNVGMVYEDLCKLSKIEEHEAINENLDENLGSSKHTFNIKTLFSSVLNYIMNSMAPIIPVLVGVSIWKTIGVLCGPSMLNLISEKNDFYILCNFLFSALFYFLPVFIGYTAAKQMKVDPIWGMFLGTLIIVPEFVSLVGKLKTFSVFGIPAPVSNYSQQFLPVLIGVWILKYVLKLLNKYIPAVISSLFVPIITVVIMTIIMFVICAPIGSYIGNIFAKIFMYLGSSPAPIRIVSMAILAGIIPIMILFGVHVAIYVAALAAGTVAGYEAFFFPCMIVASFALYGMSFGAIFKFKKTKGVATGAFISGFFAGITEPSLYGVTLKSKSSIAVSIIASAIGGLLAGIFGLKCSLLASVSILSLIPFFTVNSTMNIILGVVASAASFIIAALGVILFAHYDEAKI